MRTVLRMEGEALNRPRGLAFRVFVCFAILTPRLTAAGHAQEIGVDFGNRVGIVGFDTDDANTNAGTFHLRDG